MTYDTLKFCNDTLNSESLDMVLLRIQVKQFEESMFSCTWLLQQTVATGRHIFLGQT